jgi:hypothetical protein
LLTVSYDVGIVGQSDDWLTVSYDCGIVGQSDDWLAVSYHFGTVGQSDDWLTVSHDVGIVRAGQGVGYTCACERGGGGGFTSITKSMKPFCRPTRLCGDTHSSGQSTEYNRLCGDTHSSGQSTEYNRLCGDRGSQCGLTHITHRVSA